MRKSCLAGASRKGKFMTAEEKTAAVEALKEKAGEQALHFFHDTYDQAWVTVPSGDHRETWRVDSKKLWLWIARTLRAINIPATRKLIKSIVEEFEMTSLVDGPTLPVFVRIGEAEDVVYLDLGDQEWRAVQIRPGWLEDCSRALREVSKVSRNCRPAIASKGRRPS